MPIDRCLQAANRCQFQVGREPARAVIPLRFFSASYLNGSTPCAILEFTSLVRVLADSSLPKIPYQRGFSIFVRFLMVDHGVAPLAHPKMWSNMPGLLGRLNRRRRYDRDGIRFRGRDRLVEYPALQASYGRVSELPLLAHRLL